MESYICLWTVSLDLSHRLSACRRSRFSSQNCSGSAIPCTDCATAERGVLFKDRIEMVIVVTDRTDSVREILFEGAGVNLFEASVRKSFRFLYGYRYMELLCTRCLWSDVSPWCSFVKMRMLSLCLSRWPWL